MTLVTRPAMTDDDGTFTTGTVVNEALVDAVLDQVDDQAHSTTNPTVKPKAITDEVVTARGSKASLDARLDVSLEEDGTLKTQASLVTAAQVQSALGGRNVAVNGDLDDWSAGGALAPDSFTLAGAAATIARTGVAQADTFHFGTGSGFAAKVTRAGTNWTLTQDVIASGDFAKYVNVKSQKVSAAVKGKTGIASHLRIVVDDGVTTTASSFHTGGNTEEHLSVTHTISNTATKLSVYVEGLSSNGDAYVGGFNIVFADLAPSDWAPLSSTPDATATRRGLVGTGAQTWAGAKTFNAAPVFNAPATFKPGMSADADGTISGRITSDVTQRAHGGGAEADLTSYSLKANVLSADGKAIRITAWGRFAANANAKRVRMVFGGTTIADTTSSTSWNGFQWHMEIIVMRKDGTNQRASGVWYTAANGSTSGNHAAYESKPAETLSGAVTIATKGTGVAASDVVQEGFMVEVLG